MNQVKESEEGGGSPSLYEEIVGNLNWIVSFELKEDKKKGMKGNLYYYERLSFFYELCTCVCLDVVCVRVQ